LSRFKARGGKLLLWHGWADPALNALVTVNYYERLKAGDPTAPEYARLFMMPGVLHCGGGRGADSAEWLGPITAWVERGVAPDRIVSSRKGEEGKAVRTRPLCAYPQRAVYSGSGSTDEEKNFVCK
jgi:feruloyl esterase